MNIKSIIIAAVALTGFVGNAMADTSKLLEADGWTKITTLPTATDIANNYYVFVDNSQDLMLTIAKGVNNNGKWYSLSLWYQTSVSPTTSDILSKLWILQKGSYGDGSYALQNVEYPARLLQTEYGKGYLMETNDVSTPNEWSQLNFAYSSDGYWTIENGKYPATSSETYKGYLGPWNETNTNTNIQNGQELAGNKQGNYVGHFQIYAISRTRFQTNYLAAASSSNVVDVSFIYVNNPTLDLNINGWTRTATSLGGNAAANYCTETWHSSTDFKFYQNVSSLPEGIYQVSVQARSQTNSGAVYATVGETTVSTAVNTATSSTSMQTEATTMLDRTTGKITTPAISLDDGQTLSMGFMDNVANQWDVFDNFKLYYQGNDLSVYAAARDAVKTTAEAAIASNTVPDACETAIQNAINANSGDYTSKAAYIAAQNAIQTALDTYFTSELQSAYAAYYAFKTQVEGLMTGIADGDTKTTFTSAISTATSNMEAATTVAAINTQKANLRSAALTFISGTDGQFDITFLASQNYSDWKKKDGNNAGLVADDYLTNRPNTIPSFAESFEWTAATTGNVLYQTVSDLPAGYYQVGMYAMALSTSSRDTGITTEATEGDADRSFAFAGDQRTGLPIKFATAIDFSELTTLDVNVHLSTTGNLTFGVQKDKNGSNWHFAQIASIVYSNQPDLTNLKATRDAQVAEAMGLLNGSAEYLTSAQQTALQEAITEGNNADTFDNLNTVTLTTLPNAINTAKQQVQIVKDNRVLMLAALERFENDYNLTDGTDYSRQTMSAGAWTSLIEKVNAVSTALDDVSQATSYGTIKDELIAQMDATDQSLRLFKSYQAMAEGVSGVLGSSVAEPYAAASNMDTDATEQSAITALNSAFVDYANSQDAEFDVSAFLGANLDFSAAAGEVLNNENNNNIKAVTGWDVNYEDADTWAVVQTDQADNAGKLYIRKNWGSAAATLTASKQRMLPVGKYRLSLSWNSSLANMTNLSAFSLGNASTTIGESTTTAKTMTYDFEVTDAATAYDLIIGLKKTGTDNTPAQIVVDDITLTYITNVVKLNDASDNTELIAAANGQTANVVLQGRTLYKDGSWNTLCLPFDLTIAGSILDGDGVTAMALDAGQSSFDAGTLTLNFNSVEALEAGKPYIIKWNNTGVDLTNPRFVGVAVDATAPTAPAAIDGSVTFVGTYTPLSIADGGDNTKLFLATGNTLYWPDAAMTIGCQRAYFQLGGGITAGDPASSAGIRAINLNFDGTETLTTIDGIVNGKSVNGKSIYNVAGQRISVVQRGLNIVNGKKILVK